jgi:hypothetical protein
MLQVLEDFLTDDVQYNWVQMLTYAMRTLTYAAGAGGLPNGRRAVQLGADADVCYAYADVCCRCWRTS